METIGAFFIFFLVPLSIAWVLRKSWHVLCVLLVVALTTSCSSTSNHFEKSPCACDFRSINIDDGDKDNA